MTRVPMHRFLSRFFLAAWVLVSLGGCGGDESLTFEGCGNGIVESGEECDDGPGLAHNDDSDACLSTCKRNVCGDGFVNQGIEQCDRNNLGTCGGSAGSNCSCSQLGREEGSGLRCDTSCTYDLSGCGPALPTPTASPTATTTPSPSPTATALAGVCGDGMREADETCDDGNTSDNDACPSDCRVRSCTPTGARLSTTVVFSVPSAALARSATVLLSYPDGEVGLPDGGERARITARSGVALTLEQDFQHALRVRLNRVQGIPSADVFSVSFDTCEGGSTPQVSDFACTVLACDQATGCSCTVQLR